MRGAMAILAGFGLIAAMQPAEARPVSYPGGWTFMQMNNGDRSSVHLHYSPTAFDSIGYYGESNWADDWTYHACNTTGS